MSEKILTAEEAIEKFSSIIKQVDMPVKPKRRDDYYIFLDSATSIAEQIEYLPIIEKSYKEELRRSKERVAKEKKEKAEQKRLERLAKKKEKERLEREIREKEEYERTKEIISSLKAMKNVEAQADPIPFDKELLKIQETSNNLFNDLWFMLRNFPKWERSSLVNTIKSNIIQFIACLNQGRYVPSLRVSMYKEAQMQFESIKAALSISYKQEYISDKSAKHINIQVNYIGKMLTNLIKSAASRKSNK